MDKPLQFHCDICLLPFPLSTMLLSHKLSEHRSDIKPKVSTLITEWRQETIIYSSDSDCDYKIVTQIEKIPKIKAILKCSYSDDEDNDNNDYKDQFSIPNNIENDLGQVKLETNVEIANHNNRESFEPQNVPHNVLDNEILAKYKCDSCDKKFAHKSSLNKHCKNMHSKHVQKNEDSCEEIDSKHEMEVMFVKEVKEQRAKRKSRLDAKSKIAREELSEKPDSSIYCEFCGKEYKKQKSMLNHIKNVHNKDVGPIVESEERIDEDKNKSIFKCEPCVKFFFTYKCYVTHMNRHKNPEKLTKKKTIDNVHLCNFCGKAYAELYNLKMHLLKHTGELPFKCEVCGKAFRLKQTLQDHLYSHNGVKPYICPVDGCGKSFAHASGKRQHYECMHNNNKRFQCDHCQKRFTKKNHLVDHIRNHTGERPYACKFCNMRFKLSSTRRIHHRTHTGERPFKCELCGKGFIKSYGLKMHMKTKRNCVPQINITLQSEITAETAPVHNERIILPSQLIL